MGHSSRLAAARLQLTSAEPPPCLGDAAGGVQWMTAGRGVIHSEMPVVTSGDLHGGGMFLLGCTPRAVHVCFGEGSSLGELAAGC